MPVSKTGSIRKTQHVIGILSSLQINGVLTHGFRYSAGASTKDNCVASTQEIDAFLAGVERRAFKHALFAVQDHHSALDIVQNAMLKLVERYDGKPADELPLLFQRILQNAIHDHFRRSKVRDFWVRLVSPLRDKDEENTETLESLSATSDAVRPPSPEDEVAGSQNVAVIEQALSELPPRQREAFLLRYWEELDVAETAQVMGCSEGSVKTHCFRAVNALATKLKEKGVVP
jgi:RNA polymerase sigma-70 factor, ECF subfamily